MRIGCLQFAPQVGDIDNNLNRADSCLAKANPDDLDTLDVLVLPELAFTGMLQPQAPLASRCAAAWRICDKLMLQLSRCTCLCTTRELRLIVTQAIISSPCSRYPHTSNPRARVSVPFGPEPLPSSTILTSLLGTLNGSMCHQNGRQVPNTTALPSSSTVTEKRWLITANRFCTR